MNTKKHIITLFSVSMLTSSAWAQTDKISIELDYTFWRSLNKSSNEAVAEFQKAIDPGRKWSFVKKSKAFENEQDKFKQVSGGTGFTDHLEKFTSDAGHGTVADTFSIGSNSSLMEPLAEVTGGLKGNFCQVGVAVYALKADAGSFSLEGLKTAEASLVAVERPTGFVLKQFVDDKGLKAKPFIQSFSTTDAMEKIKSKKLKYLLTASKLYSSDKNNVTFHRDPFSYNPAVTRVYSHNSLIPCSVIFVKTNMDKNIKSKLGQALNSAKIGTARFKSIDPVEARKMKDIFDYYSKLEINFKK